MTPGYQMTDEDAAHILEMVDYKAWQQFRRNGMAGNPDDYRDRGLDALVEVLPRAENSRHLRALCALTMEHRIRGTMTAYRRWRDLPAKGVPRALRDALKLPMERPALPGYGDPWLRRRLTTAWNWLTARQQYAVICCWIDGLSKQRAADELDYGRTTLIRDLRTARAELVAAARGRGRKERYVDELS